VRGEGKRLAGLFLGDALDFVEHAPRLDDAHPAFDGAFTLTLTSFERLLGDRLVREDPDEELPLTFHFSLNRHTSRLDLPLVNPARLERLQPEVAKRDSAASVGFVCFRNLVFFG
jgi:hypothetical protein